ncbi:C1 family peptidase [Secundilactobacillus malefermentans]|uniref:aminopeptidase C n=1 Tax=Secundilactobacillus malefermentans TaxID=176292 RepID=UPI0011CC7DB6|nr:C1 family peptidase [Secundilactobacillus malefermentans]
MTESSKNAISLAQIDQYHENYLARKDAKVIQRSVSHQGILATSADFASDVDMSPVFSIDLNTGKVANQKQSGRCWMFAALNTMRHHLADLFNLSNFELSQNYTNFWDKFEKANYFYENVLATADQPRTSRKVAFLMETPQQDGGQWDMLCAIIEKYGIAPKSVMPETYNSSKSSELNSVLNTKLRKDAITLRKLVSNNATDAEIAKTRQEMLADDYKILSYSLGEPVQKFDFEYRDDDKQFHADRGLTPKSFYDKYIGWNLDDYVSIINSPTDDKPYNKTYTVEMLGNVVGGRQVKHLNVTMDNFKDLAIKQLKDGQSVWFGCDVGKSSERQKGIMDVNYYKKDELLDVDLSMSKAERLDYGESLMTHAMVITGVDLVEGKPTKWKVENSWGEKVGTKGYFVMSDAWMEEYCYQVVVNKKYLSEDLLKAQSENPALLAPWDPMGALASN